MLRREWRPRRNSALSASKRAAIMHRWGNPETRAAKRAHQARKMREFWASPEGQERKRQMSEASAAYNTPERREAAHIREFKYWTPERRAGHSLMIRGIKAQQRGE